MNASLEALNGGSPPQDTRAAEPLSPISFPSKTIQDYSEKLCFAEAIYEVSFPSPTICF